MKKILHIISSPRGDASFSAKLGNAIVEKIQASYPGSTVTARDLNALAFPHLGQVHLNAFFTPAEKRDPELIDAIKHSDEAIKDVLDADIIVIGAPIYNFNIHSALKAWIDQIVRSGITFKYDEKTGPEGLLKDKKVYIAISSKGVYSSPPMQALDYVEPYLKTILGFIGLTDITVFRVEGYSTPAEQQVELEKVMDGMQIS